MKPLSFLSVKEDRYLSLAVLFIVGCFFTGCATVPSEVRSDEPIEQEAKQGKLSSEKSKDVSSAIPQGELSEIDAKESSSKIQADDHFKKSGSVDHPIGNGKKVIKDLALPNKEEISSSLKIVNQKTPLTRAGHAMKNLAEDTVSQKGKDDIGSFFSTDNAVEKLPSEESDELNPVGDEPWIDSKDGEEMKPAKPRVQIKKRGDTSLLDNEKSLGRTIPISDSGDNIENAGAVLKSKEILSTAEPKKIVGFSGQLKSAEGNDPTTDDGSIGFLEHPDSSLRKGKLIRSVKRVGFGVNKLEGDDLNITDEPNRKNEFSGQKPRAFGRIKTYLSRGGVSGIEEGVTKNTDFKRTKIFLKTDRSGEILNFPIADQKDGMQYDKTLNWIKSRGRVDGSKVVE